MDLSDTADLWYKNAIIYCVDVESYLDTDGDGVGDLRGIIQRIDYLARLGVTCLWLMPIYPSPRRDHGYDVTDGYGVDERYGTPGDLVELIRVAHDRGIRVIVDFIINHTSDQHRWFRGARQSTTSPFRDYYVWRSEDPGDTSDESMFPEVEDGIWTLDDKTGEYYLHHFFHHQPDLNTANPAVRREIIKLMGYWLQLGVDGFRVDAVPSALNPTTTVGDDTHDLEQPHEYLRELRSFLERRSAEKGPGIMLGEVNLPHDEQERFFGGKEGDELTMQFDFATNQCLYLALARSEAAPLAESLGSRPTELDARSQYANFLRNHDELTLDLLSDDERQEVFDAFAPEEEMRVFGRGIRRRLPPMLDADPRRVKLAYSLLFALPGTPVLFYGEEIGMGENLDLEERVAVRSPMQWSAQKNGGFSTASPSRLSRSVTSGSFGPEHVNVAGARRDPDSLLSHITKLAHRYRECPELGWGAHTVIEQEHAAVLAHRVDWGERSCILLHNLGPEALTVEFEIDDADEGVEFLDLLSDSSCTVAANRSAQVGLQGYGYRWLKRKDRFDGGLI